METWIAVAERFGLPLVLLLGVVYGIVKLFNWMANDMMQQIKKNEERIENIVIKLIDNSKKQVEAINKDRVMSNQKFESILNRMDAIVDVMVKLTGNGLGKR